MKPDVSFSVQYFKRTNVNSFQYNGTPKTWCHTWLCIIAESEFYLLSFPCVVACHGPSFAKRQNNQVDSVHGAFRTSHFEAELTETQTSAVHADDDQKKKVGQKGNTVSGHCELSGLNYFATLFLSELFVKREEKRRHRGRKLAWQLGVFCFLSWVLLGGAAHVCLTKRTKVKSSTFLSSGIFFCIFKQRGRQFSALQLQLMMQAGGSRMECNFWDTTESTLATAWHVTS